jgi:TPP-dependent pyruvate/acetoin dehydrogenase alpha subunit
MATTNAHDRMELIALLRAMMRSRDFERCLMELPQPGFQLLSAGEEAVAVGVCAALAPGDQLLCSGRAIAPALARGVEPAALLAELLGKKSGPCGGRGGRGHVAHAASGLFGAHAVVGGNLSVAAGVALALQMQNRPAIAVCLFGDGACGCGALHETLNIAALWRLPLLLVCSNNQYAISTPVAQGLAPQHLAELARPFGVPAQTIDGMDVRAVRHAATALARRARAGEGPAFLECLTCRLVPHSSASRECRSAEELQRGLARCPIRSFTEWLVGQELIDETALDQLRRDIAQENAAACRAALEAPDPDLPEGLDDDH